MGAEPRYLVIDTETNGLFDFKMPADAEGQPRLAHMTMIALAGSAVWLKVNAYIKPVGWGMTPETTAINGLTNERLDAVGIPVRELLDLYAYLIDAGHVVVAFNTAFDLKVMRGELRHADMDDRFKKTPSICTMIASTDLCRIPKPSGAAGWKFPKLKEAMAHFGLKQAGEHTALGDAQACLDLFIALQAAGVPLNPGIPKG
jgi:DNA polymerase III subunit epsilon